jgi:hypothetical protein
MIYARTIINDLLISIGRVKLSAAL